MAAKTKEHKENIAKGMIGNDNAKKYEGEKTDKQIYKLCLLGLTDIEIADILGISKSILNKWKIDYPSVLDSISKGKHIADIKIVKSLYKSARGHQVVLDKEVYNQKLDKVVQIQETVYVPPDVRAQIKWLSARRKEVWSEKIALTGGTNEKGEDKPIQIEMPEWLMSTRIKNGQPKE
jgi:transcriptional regulator with XRE-family HTH domain